VYILENAGREKGEEDKKEKEARGKINGKF
jgi:hypothetical protein